MKEHLYYIIFYPHVENFYKKSLKKALTKLDWFDKIKAQQLNKESIWTN